MKKAIANLNHRPPKPSEEADCHLWQTRNHRIEFIDSGKNQGIRIETAKGKIRCVLTKDGGIEVANDLGGLMSIKNTTKTAIFLRCLAQ